MEYRRVANSYLSTKTVRKPTDIELSPIESVNQMLVADKVQNRKDFVAKLYKSENRDSYDRASERYIEYFDSWLAALNVTPADYEALASELHREFNAGG